MKRNELYQKDDLDLLTATIYGEARGEPIEGKVAVGWVIKNRTLDGRWSDNFKNVILQKKQFSCWNVKDKNYEKSVWALVPSRCSLDLVWRECRLVAHGILYDRLLDNTKGSNHYHANNIEKPYWAKVKECEFKDMIGSQLFYEMKKK